MAISETVLILAGGTAVLSILFGIRLAMRAAGGAAAAPQSDGGKASAAGGSGPADDGARRRWHLWADAKPTLSGNDPGLPGVERRGGKPMGDRAGGAAVMGDQCRRRCARGALSGTQVRGCVSRLQGAGEAV